MGNHPSKFQLAGVRRFGGVREQTNKQTHSLIDRLALLYFTYSIIHIVSFSEKPEQLKKERRRGTLEVELNLFSGLEFNTYFFS